VVVGVSCSVVGPKRYERWGVLESLEKDTEDGPFYNIYR